MATKNVQSPTGANGPGYNLRKMKKKANPPFGDIGLNLIALLFREVNPSFCVSVQLNVKRLAATASTLDVGIVKLESRPC